jgi:hypothetical protein
VVLRATAPTSLPPWSRLLRDTGHGGDYFCVLILTPQQIIRGTPEGISQLDEQFRPWLLFPLLDLGEMLSWLSHPPGQLALIPPIPQTSSTDTLTNQLVDFHGALLSLS